MQWKKFLEIKYVRPYWYDFDNGIVHNYPAEFENAYWVYPINTYIYKRDWDDFYKNVKNGYIRPKIRENNAMIIAMHNEQ